MDKTTARQREVLRDFAELVAKAFFGGLGAAIVMAAAILALSPAAQAATPPCLDVDRDEPRSVAPAPPIEQPSAGTGALWASTADAPATLQFVAGCMALAMAGGVTLVARRMA